MSLPYPDPLMSAAPAEPHSPSMFSSILRRRKTTVLGIAGLVVLLTIAITARETKIYDATASVVVQGPPTTGGQSQVNMATEAAVAGSPAVAKLVITQEHLKSVTARQLERPPFGARPGGQPGAAVHLREPEPAGCTGAGGGVCRGLSVVPHG